MSTMMLDGGAMFGSVPRTMWEKKIAPDERHRIPLVSRSLIIEFGDRRILVDCGCGTKWSEKLRSIYEINSIPETDYPQGITDLLLSHLHFDHAAGISAWKDESHALKPLFPGARVLVQRENFNNATSPHIKERASYLTETVASLSFHELTLLDGKTEIFQGITVHPANGHTRGQQWISITDGGTTVIFAADVIPTSHHLHPAFHLGYDMCAERALAEKAELLHFAATNNAIVVFEHDAHVAALRVCFDSAGEITFAPFYGESVL